MVNILFLVLILDEGYDKKVNLFLNKHGIKFKTVSSAIGTASPSVLDYFGLTETRKEVFFAVIPNYLEEKLLSKIKTTFKLEQQGSGVAFTIPITSSNKFLSDIFSKEEASEKGDNIMEDEIKYHLVITVVLEGYLEQVMAAAKRAGATGGTVIKARGLANIMPNKVLGFNIEPERELILNIVDDESKNKVMEEITKTCGIKTGGKGVCVALPISMAEGLTKNINKY